MSCLLIIDVQNDFLDNGSFAIKHSRSIVPRINQLMNAHYWDLVAASRDWHPENHVSFASTQQKDLYAPITLTNGEQSVESLAWPDHCVADTWGAQLDPDLDTSQFRLVVSKGTDPQRECFSAFKDVFGRPTELNSELKSFSIHTVYVVGVATEYCVLQSVLDCLGYGYKTVVVQDCIYGVDEGGCGRALDRMKEAGALMAWLDDFLNW